MGLAYLRGSASASAINDMLKAVDDPAAFESAFGCKLNDVDQYLIELNRGVAQLTL